MGFSKLVGRSLKMSLNRCVNVGLQTTGKFF